jgi:hypothetical protein
MAAHHIDHATAAKRIARLGLAAQPMCFQDIALAFRGKEGGCAATESGDESPHSCAFERTEPAGWKSLPGLV